MRLTKRVTFLACLALLTACGGADETDTGAVDGDTARTAGPHEVETGHGTHPDAPGGEGRSAEQDHSGAYNLIEDARSTADEANERIHEMESTLGDL